MAPRAVLFDMDDTLLDYMGHVDVSWNVVCAELAGPHGADADALRTAIREEAMTFWRDEAAVEHWRVRLDDARLEVVRRAMARFDVPQHLAPEISGAYRDEVERRMALFDDTIETLDHLRSAGTRLAIITNGPAEQQRAKVLRFELAPLVDHVVIEGEFGKGKPHPEVFGHALETLGVDAGDAWMVGDNLYADIGGAQAAGIHAVWIHRERLQMPDEPPARPDRSVSNLREMLAALSD